MTTGKTALVLGATGLVGNELIGLLAQDSRYSRVTCLIRSKHGVVQDTDKIQWIEVDFADFTNQTQSGMSHFAVDHVYVCLGTTIKTAGSQKAFREIDFDLVYAAAQKALQQSVQSFVWISSVGADASSRNFYLHVKGQLEDAIFSLTGYTHFATVRPSLLLGQRKEWRLAEKIGTTLAPFYSPLLEGSLSKYKPIQANDVAKNMILQQRF